jgi:hypothetical protein
MRARDTGLAEVAGVRRRNIPLLPHATARCGTPGGAVDPDGSARVQVDSWWATQILAGDVAVVGMERRLGEPVPSLIANIASVVESRKLGRIDSRVVAPTDDIGGARSHSVPALSPPTLSAADSESSPPTSKPR